MKTLNKIILTLILISLISCNTTEFYSKKDVDSLVVEVKSNNLQLIDSIASLKTFILNNVGTVNNYYIDSSKTYIDSSTTRDLRTIIDSIGSITNNYTGNIYQYGELNARFTEDTLFFGIDTILLRRVDSLTFYEKN